MSYKTRVNNLAPVAKKISMGNLLDAVCGVLRGDEVLTSETTLSIGTSSKKALKVGAVTGWINGVYFTANAQEKAFTATDHDVAKDKWSSYRISIVANGTVTITKAAADYASRALAIAAVPECPAANVDLGYIIVLADGALFDATTTDLDAKTVDVEYVPATNYVIDFD